jgi:glycosyltransferase involved in cell wall biosynthesis
MSKGTIVYIGAFELPDGNAAAHRVIGNAKALRDIGYNVVLIGKGGNSNELFNKSEYYGFECWNETLPKSKLNILKSLIDVKNIYTIISKISDLKMVIVYNYPAVALGKIYKYCKSRGIKCVADVTEWYGVQNRSLVYKVFKGIDSMLRMRVFHKRIDGLIVISSYLGEYYNSQQIVVIPPLIDIEDEKWKSINCSKQEQDLTFVYAGSPSKSKERLDVIIDTIAKVQNEYPIKLIIVGITKEQYQNIYGDLPEKIINSRNKSVLFKGRVSHSESLNYVKQAYYTFIIREDSRLTRAGFPTKFVESVTCGTPVITTASSDLNKYIINDRENGEIVTFENIEEKFKKIIQNNNRLVVNRTLFDYREYTPKLNEFVEKILEAKNG